MAASIPDLVVAVGDEAPVFNEKAVVIETWVLEPVGYASEVLDGAPETIVLPLLHPYITDVIRLNERVT
jgi:hypothetical protein